MPTLTISIHASKISVAAVWLSIFIAAIITSAVTVGMYGQFVHHREAELLKETIQHQKKEFEHQTVNGQLMGGAILAGLLDDDIKKVASGEWPPDAPEAMEILQAIVHQYDAGNAFVVNSKGIIVAHWSGPGNPSGTGTNISFRTYFKEGMKGSNQVYPAVSVVSGKRVFYFSAPVYAKHTHHSDIIGVLAISIKPHALDLMLQNPRGHKLLLSAQGVVFGSDLPENLFRIARPITATTQAELNELKQFGNMFVQHSPQPLGLDLSGESTQYQGKTYAIAQTTIDWHDPLGLWTLVLLEDTEIWLPRRRKIELFIVLALFSFLTYGTLYIAIKSYSSKKKETQARMQVQKELANKSELLQVVIANLQQGLAAFDDQWRLILNNKRFCDILDVPEALIHTRPTFQDLMRYWVNRGDFGDGDPQEVFQRLMAHVAECDHHQFERIRPDGTILEVRGGPLPDGGFVTTYTDITERKRVERRMLTLSMAVEQSPVSIVITDPKARIEYVNSSFTRVSGYSAAEVVGRNPKILKSGTMSPEIYHDLWTTLAQGMTWKGELLNRAKDGQLFWELTTISPIYDSDGQILHFIANKEDITERKIADEKLKEALRHISGSIQYASRIQRSILTPETLIQMEIPEYFILWEPRDVVGGDMYWYRSWVTGSLLLLGDCTGHGVPGAFMTLIANGSLDQALLETPPGETSILLQRISRLIQISMGQDQEDGQSNDGLELGVCFLDFDKKILRFSGARFSLFVVDDEGVREIKGEKSGVGYRGIDHNVRFTSHPLELRPDWSYYMTSDGLIDQIGWQRPQSFGKRRFMELIKSLRPIPIRQHGDHIRKALLDFQGSQTRRDDVTVLGFRGISSLL
ncbi:MAG: PAS-domain containing protein [Magnetococcales bacterium]|nr:PAS-domain containing protein [Magnetococcales bacterium]